MTITVIIPTYNAEAYLAEALASVRRQTLAPDEIIIVDDGSTDSTPAVINALGADLQVLRQPNSGPSAARNRGLSAARGDLIAFLDADDWWPDDKLALQTARLAAEPDVQVVIGHLLHVCAPDVAALPSAQTYPSEPVANVNLGAALFRRAAFEQVGGFDEALRFSEDQDWFLRARERGLPLRILPEVTLYYRIHSASLTWQQRGRGLLAALKQSLDRRRASGAEALPPWDSYRAAGEARPPAHEPPLP